jgi:hypothetical protein
VTFKVTGRENMELTIQFLGVLGSMVVFVTICALEGAN